MIRPLGGPDGGPGSETVLGRASAQLSHHESWPGNGDPVRGRPASTRPPVRDSPPVLYASRVAVVFPPGRPHTCVLFAVVRRRAKQRRAWRRPSHGRGPVSGRAIRLRALIGRGRGDGAGDEAIQRARSPVSMAVTNRGPPLLPPGSVVASPPLRLPAGGSARNRRLPTALSAPNDARGIRWCVRQAQRRLAALLGAGTGACLAVSRSGDQADGSVGLGDRRAWPAAKGLSTTSGAGGGGGPAKGAMLRKRFVGCRAPSTRSREQAAERAPKAP